MSRKGKRRGYRKSGIENNALVVHIAHHTERSNVCSECSDKSKRGYLVHTDLTAYLAHGLFNKSTHNIKQRECARHYRSSVKANAHALHNVFRMGYDIHIKKKFRNLDKILTKEERNHVTSAPHTLDLEPLFARAKVLVDIDADLEKDPFLSSKIVTYLKVNRVILSETGKITPSREMFAGLNTVVQCDHNEESLYKGMLRAIELADSNPDFSEREPLVEKFSIERVASILDESLKELHNTK
jgi:hypothetical protein